MDSVDMLHKRFGSLLDRKGFKRVIGSVLFLNPLALAPQVWTALTAPSIEGISLTMWVIFVVIQIAMVLEGIRVKSSAMFWSMLISVCESITIIIAVFAR
ncbi:MAG: hypothetical protein ABIJ21_05140 [Nanoarchaeota archaeon]